MRMILFVARILCAVSFPVLIISSTVSIYVSSLHLYNYDFEKYHISEVTGISEAQLDNVAVMMARYLGGKSNTPQVTVNRDGKDLPLYNQKELLHLADVRIITDLFRILVIASLIVVLITGIMLFYREGAVTLIRQMRNGGIIALLFTGILVIWAVLDFDSLFYLFHILSFSNDLWLLDPTRDYLIMMFPQAFFNDAAITLIATIIVESIVLLAAALIIQKLLVKQQTNA